MRAFKIAICLVLAALLCGCSQAHEIESIAFPVILGADLLEDGVIELTIQLPRASDSGGGQEEQGSSAPQYLIASATGATFADALAALELTVPRNLNLSQVKVLVVSEALARDARFREIVEQIVNIERFYTACYLAVCQGNMREFVEAQKPVIGMRVSLGLIAMFEHHSRRGYISKVSLADFYYASSSIYSDPVAVLCATTDEKEATPQEHALDGMMPDDVPAQSENKNVYVGTALFRDGTMVDTLDGLESCLLNALRGEAINFGYSVGEQALALQAPGLTRVKVTADEAGEATIALELHFHAGNDLDRSMFDVVAEAVRQDILRLLARCQRLGVEPFGFAEHAATGFDTIDAWLEYDWPARFSRAKFDVRVTVSGT